MSGTEPPQETTTTMTTEAKTLTITMSDRPPVRIVADEWPLIALADRHDGKVEYQANHVWAIRVREHEDGRRLVYGYLRGGPGGVRDDWRGAAGGYLVEAGDDEATVRAIRRIGGIIDDARLADECIADLPAQDIDASRAQNRLALLLALLVQARPHCPPDLQEEIRSALAGE